MKVNFKLVLALAFASLSCNIICGRLSAVFFYNYTWQKIPRNILGFIMDLNQELINKTTKNGVYACNIDGIWLLPKLPDWLTWCMCNSTLLFVATGIEHSLSMIWFLLVLFTFSNFNSGKLWIHIWTSVRMR